jgi:hypothetical protein
VVIRPKTYVADSKKAEVTKKPGMIKSKFKLSGFKKTINTIGKIARLWSKTRVFFQMERST